MNKSLIGAVLCSGLFLFGGIGCKKPAGQHNTPTSTENTLTAQIERPTFSCDSAYLYVKQQIDFGPRVPGSTGHNACRQYLVNELTRHGAQVVEQPFVGKVFTGETFKMTNIIGSFGLEKEQRILLLAHWDTRPFADEESAAELAKKPILGADDGGSGVAVLLEIARQLGSQPDAPGVDILFVDGEDYGNEGEEASWCLGSTHFSQNPHKPNYHPEYAILLDMVGARGAKFYWEGFSRMYAPHILSKVWQTASDLGYGELFVHADGSGLTDDHVPLIKHAQIPAIDIVNFDPTRQKGFGTHWHTHQDNIDIIDKDVLQAVGEVVLKVIQTP